MEGVVAGRICVHAVLAVWTVFASRAAARGNAEHCGGADDDA